MRVALRHIGLSDRWIALRRLFYEGNRQQIGDVPSAAFVAEVGIRQGCPLSPILFAVAMDVLLRRLFRYTSDATIRAFADDIASLPVEPLPAAARHHADAHDMAGGFRAGERMLGNDSNLAT